MDDHELVEQLKLFAINHNLPRTDVALFGVKCPYCGKSDRIKPMEHPETLCSRMDADDLAAYENFWKRLNGSNGSRSSLGVCKFCQNLLKLGENSRTEPLVQ